MTYGTKSSDEWYYYPSVQKWLVKKVRFLKNVFTNFAFEITFQFKPESL